jgi:hypothetical protein
MRRHTILRVGVIAAVAGAVAAGIAYAAIPHPLYGDTTACYKTSNGQLRVIDVPAGDTCSESEQPLGLYQGYVQLVQRLAGPSALAGPAFTPVVGSSLLGSHVRPVYAITAKAVVETKLAAESRCRLTAENVETPQFVLDESRNVPAINATHNLQGVVFAPMDIRVVCTADQDWTAIESSIMGVKVGKGATVLTTDADPITP